MCLALLFSPPGLAQNSNPYLSEISIERAHPGQPITEGRARMTLQVRDPDLSTTALSGVDGVEIVASDERSVSIVFDSASTISGQPDEKFRRNTFVVDFEEAAVLSLLQELHPTETQRPSAEQLVTYVYEHIDNKTYSRSFDFASRVAETGEGDCTEHAVLLAALARSSGYYARVAIGTLILDTESESFAFSHAWTEIHDGSRWQIKDATMPGGDSALRHIRYLPLAILDDEGPGYSLGLVRALMSMPLTITGLANPD